MVDFYMGLATTFLVIARAEFLRFLEKRLAGALTLVSTAFIYTCLPGMIFAHNVFFIYIARSLIPHQEMPSGHSYFHPIDQVGITEAIIKC